MNGEYAVYIGSAYALTILVLGGLVLQSWLAWKKTGKDAGDA